jgi:hypothetical protein
MQKNKTATGYAHGSLGKQKGHGRERAVATSNKRDFSANRRTPRRYNDVAYGKFHLLGFLRAVVHEVRLLSL